MKKLKGFTLIELLVVIVIIGILAVVAIPKLLAAIDKAKSAVAKSDIGSMNSAIQMYQSDHSNYIFPVYAEGKAVSTVGLSICTTYMPVVPRGPFSEDEERDGALDYSYIGTTSDYTITVPITKPIAKR